MLKIEYLAETHFVRISLDGLQTSIWNEVRKVCEENSEELRITSSSSIEIPWWSFLSCAKSIDLVGRRYKVILQLDELTKKMLKHAQKNRQKFKLSKETLPIDKELIAQKLISTNFKRPLTSQQLRNVAKLYSLSGGATFSVPGAGKTTEALALFTLKKKVNSKLLIVAPKNAFPAWEEQVIECLTNPPNIVRLRGGEKNIQVLLEQDPEISLITYQQFPNVINTIAKHYTKNDFFLILDESHRIKRGNSGVIGKSILNISHLPSEKLIMSGTPMPNSPEDLVSQFNFLYPEVKIDKDTVLHEIQSIYVRTTKNELDIPKYTMRYVEVEMSASQRKIYDLLKSETLRQLEALEMPDKYKLRSLGKSVMKLLQATSNPALLLKNDENFSEDLKSLIMQGDSSKLDYVINRTRELVKDKKKVLIWSSFTDNIEILNSRLKDLGADYIHGGVDSGFEEDIDTREYKIKNFHENENSMVLIANPAAASEGISLHTICHNAIYMDRNYNAAQFLQSVDRIHRLGLSKEIKTLIEIVTCANSIDDSVNRRLTQKIENMAMVLNDQSIVVEPEYSDEEISSNVAEEVILENLNMKDVEDLMQQLRGQ